MVNELFIIKMEIFEGQFLNDNFLGNGKFINEDGEYYIGQFFNSLLYGNELCIIRMELYNIMQNFLKVIYMEKKRKKIYMKMVNII